MREHMAGPRRPVSAFYRFKAGVVILLEHRPLRGETTPEDLRPTNLILLADELLVRWFEIFHWKLSIVKKGGNSGDQEFH
jgi:hypothetical protein